MSLYYEYLNCAYCCHTSPRRLLLFATHIYALQEGTRKFYDCLDKPLSLAASNAAPLRRVFQIAFIPFDEGIPPHLMIYDIEADDDAQLRHAPDIIFRPRI